MCAVVNGRGREGEALCLLGSRCNRVCVFWHCYRLKKCQDETASTSVCMCHYIRLHVFNNSTRDLDSGPGHMFRLSTEVQLIKAVCTAQQQRVGFTTSRTKKNHRNLFFLGDHSKGIAFASNRVQVVRSYTCATTTQAISACPTVSSSERVSHLSHCTSHLTRYSLRPTNNPHKDH